MPFSPSARQLRLAADRDAALTARKIGWGFFSSPLMIPDLRSNAAVPAAALAAAGHVNERGAPFAAMSVRNMLAQRT